MGLSKISPSFQALAPCLGRLLCSHRACPSYTLYGKDSLAKIGDNGVSSTLVLPVFVFYITT